MNSFGGKTLSLHTVNINRVLKQIKIDRVKQLFIWKPDKLKDNIFELITIVGKLESIGTMDGSPFQINKTTYAWKYLTKEELTAMDLAMSLSEKE